MYIYFLGSVIFVSHLIFSLNGIHLCEWCEAWISFCPKWTDNCPNILYHGQFYRTVNSYLYSELFLDFLFLVPHDIF